MLPADRLRSHAPSRRGAGFPPLQRAGTLTDDLWKKRRTEMKGKAEVGGGGLVTLTGKSIEARCLLIGCWANLGSAALASPWVIESLSPDPLRAD